MINDKILTHSIDKLPPEQYGFVPGISTNDAIEVLTNSVKTALTKQKGKLYACFVDFPKAFDSIDRDRLIEKLAYQLNHLTTE